MAAMLIARFRGDVEELTAACGRARSLILSRGDALASGELGHHCATDDIEADAHQRGLPVR